MKTLDEVIFEAPYTQTPWEADALSYLKEYKELSKMWNDRLDKENSNSALTWEQLKQMEGKPVWTEDVIHEKGEWLLIHIVKGDDVWYVDKWADKQMFNRDGYGRLWQAYRKERE